MFEQEGKVILNVLAIIPARCGSKGVPGKNVRRILDKPVVCYTIEAALAAKTVGKIVVTTDDPQVKEICGAYGDKITLIDRPTELAGDNARIDDVMRHACRELSRRREYKADIVVLLYANIPVRADDIIDRAVNRLIETEGDSIQTLGTVGKFHPYWMYEMRGEDRISKYIDNQVYRRQELPPLYVIDGAVGAVKYETLMAAEGAEDPHAFWGRDRRGIAQEGLETVDIDSLRDFYLAEAALRQKKAAAKLGR